MLWKNKQGGLKMAYKLQVVDETHGISFNSKRDNLSNYKRPDVVATASNGTVVKERTLYQGQVLPAGSTNRQWADEQGNLFAKAELTFTYEDEVVEENSMTKVFQVMSFEPETNYTDRYVIDKYYELFPSNNDMKKDFDREVALRSNLSQMYKLWERLHNNGEVARGEFCVSSRGFVSSDGYIRAISVEGKWTLEVGVFKEEKIFNHLNDGVPTATTIPKAVPSKRIRMI
jgi:hypothetical protein